MSIITGRSTDAGLERMKKEKPAITFILIALCRLMKKKEEKPEPPPIEEEAYYQPSIDEDDSAMLPFSLE